MSHLHTERLAELAEEPATQGELAHLANCAHCSAEHAAFVALGQLARSGTAIAPPLTSWEALGPLLREEAIITPPVGRRWGGARPFLRIAAGFLLVAGGAVVGRLSAGDSSVAAPSGPATAGVSQERGAVTFASIQEAEAALARSEAVYQSASAFLAQSEPAAAVASPRLLMGRLAALEKVSEIVNEGLREAPSDPVMNNMALYASGQREATIRQHNAVMPASLRSTTY